MYIEGMDLAHLLSRSQATAEFQAAVETFANSYSAERIGTARRSPPVKVLRVLAQLLHEEPTLEIERVHIDAFSGCSDFRGNIRVDTTSGSRTFDFHWDCNWAAREQGWVDWFNLPDQIRAARELDWRCFAEWRERLDVTLEQAQPVNVINLA
jgi:hypothetical protein